MAHRNWLAGFSDSEGTLKARRITHCMQGHAPTPLPYGCDIVSRTYCHIFSVRGGHQCLSVLSVMIQVYRTPTRRIPSFVIVLPASSHAANRRRTDLPTGKERMRPGRRALLILPTWSRSMPVLMRCVPRCLVRRLRLHRLLRSIHLSNC